MRRFTVRDRGSVGRRGLLAGVAALVAGALGRVTAAPSEAADGDTVELGHNNFASRRTVLGADLGNLGGPALAVRNSLLSVLSPDDPNRAVFAESDAPQVAVDDRSTGLGAEGGNGSGAGIGGVGAFATGGNSEVQAAGTGLVAVGGDAEMRPGGAGAECHGGPSEASASGVGLRAVGGASIHPPGGSSGPGIGAFGGGSLTGAGGAGLLAAGGDALAPGVVPTTGIVAYGGTGRRGAASAAGLVGIGGGPDESHSFGVDSEGSSIDQGMQTTFPGLYGSNDGAGPGLAGQCKSEAGQPDTAIAAVHGVSVNGTGGSFESDAGTGLIALGQNIGVHGLSTSQVGLIGVSVSVATFGIVGTSVSGRGCDARATTSNGGYFQTESAAVAALVFSNSQANGGLGGNGSRGLFLNGTWVVQNGTKKAMVQTSRGMASLYSLEATVSLFEDLGVARLVNGRARVDLDPIFAETIERDSYHVFLTARGETGGVYVAAQDERGFELRARQPGVVPVDVDYRVVAQRKGLAPAHRLATFQPPPPVRPPDPRWLRQPERRPIPTLSVPPRPPHPERPPAPTGEEAS
jgi:hypothetical protein